MRLAKPCFSIQMDSELLASAESAGYKNDVSTSETRLITTMQPGTSVVLASIEGDPQIVERLGELGFLPGETLVFQRRIVFQGPLIVEVRGVPVALRVEEASCLWVRSK